MTDHVLDRAHLAEAVGNDIADMAHFWMLRKFQFLEPAREQFEIIVDPWLSYRTEPSQNEIMAYNMAFTDWLLFERPYRHGKTLLELYVDEPPASLSPASLKRLEQVRDLYARGADVIKLFVTGGVFDATEVGEPGVLRMPVEVAAAACKAAHDMGLPVMAHVESTEGVKVALEAGVDTIEHGAPLTSEILELYRGAAGTQLEGRAPSVTCTISPALPFVLLDPEKTHSTDTQKKNGDIVCSGIIESARAALEAGVKVGLGTDSSCPFVTQYDMWREMAYFAKYVGVSNAFALHTATQVNAELLGLGGETGTIECGKAADILVTRKNPLDDLCALREPAYVMCRGDLVRKLKVKRIPEVDAELDTIMAMPSEALAEELARDGVA